MFMSIFLHIPWHARASAPLRYTQAIVRRGEPVQF
jgi:hypothetical protein